MAGRRYKALVLLLATMAAVVSAQTIVPTTKPLSPDMLMGNIYLSLTGGSVTMPGQTVFMLAPLTPEAGLNQAANALATLHPSGSVRLIDSKSIENLAANQIAFIPCDQSNATGDETSSLVSRAGQIRPQAIVMYSVLAEACILSGAYNYSSLYTTTSQKDSASLIKSIETFPQTANPITANISSNVTSAGDVGSDGGPAPTTAVAMSILYSITGLITLLFLIIIGTGAVRAHRHPERYGPRGALAGRPRQSRAKGLARAMLETLPIVKFGDPTPEKPGNGDVELQNGTPPRTPTAAASADPSVSAATATVPAGHVDDASTDKDDSAASVTNEVDLGCSICTEDFTAGEDVRVLPCNHKYHPACIDPWLLNVSGTCPLCRLDLRPSEARGDVANASSPASSAHGDLAPPLAVGDAQDGAPTAHPGRISRFFDLHRLRHASPDERIAALRRYRQQSQQESDATAAAAAGSTDATSSPSAPPPGEETDERRRRSRLTTRLRETFHIRTRAQHGSTGSTLTPGVDV